MKIFLKKHTFLILMLVSQASYTLFGFGSQQPNKTEQIKALQKELEKQQRALLELQELNRQQQLKRQQILSWLAQNTQQQKSMLTTSQPSPTQNIVRSMACAAAMYALKPYIAQQITNLSTIHIAPGMIGSAVSHVLQPWIAQLVVTPIVSPIAIALTSKAVAITFNTLEPIAIALTSKAVAITFNTIEPIIDQHVSEFKQNPHNAKHLFRWMQDAAIKRISPHKITKAQQELIQNNFRNNLLY